MRSYNLAWTIATRCCTALRTGCCRSCSQFKTQPHAWSLGRDGETTSRRCYASCTGCQSDSALSSKSPVWPSNHWLAKYRNAYPVTVVLSLDCFDRHTQEIASFHERTTVMGIAMSLCPALSNGTLYQWNSVKHT